MQVCSYSNVARSTLPLDDQMMELIARRFRVLGELQRLRILQVLDLGEQPVGSIVDALSGNQSNISRHLQALHDAGLISRRRKGSSILYSIADPIVFKLCSLVCRSAADQAEQTLSLVATQRKRTRKATR